MFKQLYRTALQLIPVSKNFVKMSKESFASVKVENMNCDAFKVLTEKTSRLTKERAFVVLPEEHLKKTNLKTSFPLIYRVLKHYYRINTDNIEARIFPKQYLESYKNVEKSGINTNDKDAETTRNEKNHHNDTLSVKPSEQKKVETNETYIEQNNIDNNNKNNNNNSNSTYYKEYEEEAKERNKKGSADFLESLVQVKISALNESEKNHLFKHIIELIDVVAAETVYRHCLGTYHENNKYNFVTALFNNLKVYKTNELPHEFNFSLDSNAPVTINSYIVVGGTTSYIIKLDFFQDSELIFDLYATFVNINMKTFKTESVLSVENETNNEEYVKVKTFSEHLKTVQSLFNHRDIKNKRLVDDDISFVRNYFRNSTIQKIKSTIINSEKENSNIHDIYLDINPAETAETAETADPKKKQQNAISLLQLFDMNNLSFFIGRKNYFCSDSFTESTYFITSEFKNIHNFTFGGYLAHLSFCHAFAVIKKFIANPVLIGINEIQYILPVPYNSTVLYKGKVVYSNEKGIYIKICAYCYDMLKNICYLTTIFDLSFHNNEGIAFIPQSEEEVTLYLFSHMRSTLIQ